MTATALQGRQAQQAEPRRQPHTQHTDSTQAQHTKRETQHTNTQHTKRDTTHKQQVSNRHRQGVSRHGAHTERGTSRERGGSKE